MAAGFELFDHTADMGVRAFAKTLDQLPGQAVQGLYACTGELVGDAEPRPWSFAGEGRDEATLLRDFLHAVLMLLEAEGRLAADLVTEEFSPQRLRIRGTSVLLDRQRSDLCREVKAVTYHELAVVRTPTGVEATFIVDI